MSVPLSFDFGGQAIRPDYVIKCSYGNDSIALIQWVREYAQKHPLGKVVVLYNWTGWGASWWAARVENGEKLVMRCGFIPYRTESIGMERLIVERNTWPSQQKRFCTKILKILPTQHWLSQHDPEGQAELVCGVRREESAERANWPEWADADPKNEGRPNWSPLVHHTAAQRDELIERAGWKVLPHRSRECRCILANAQDIKRFSEEDIADIDRLEVMMGKRTDPPNSLMFNPGDKKGRPHGIRQVLEWAKRVKKKDDKQPGAGCDSGYCTG